MNERPNFSVMAGLDPATQWPRVCAAVKRSERSKFIDNANESPARADARALGGRVKPGHDEPKKRAPASIGDIPISAEILYLRHTAKTPAHVTPRDASVTAM
ncbi:MAG: hypothetical protein JNL06_05330 [Alphaproteobacteria bacterium]|nr:hypothetical protein [Alphaproteobacteria bacterium]